MCKPNDNDLEGKCEDGNRRNEKGDGSTRQDNAAPSEVLVKRCVVCREKFTLPDAAYSVPLQTMCITCRKLGGHLEPRYSYSVQVHIGDPGLYYVQRLKPGDHRETDWYTVKSYMSFADAMRYIYDRTGER